jgi:hypothetical protein
MILHSAVDRSAPRSMRVALSDALGLPCGSQPRTLRHRGDEGGSTVSRIFSRPHEEYEADLGLTPLQGYVDMLGEMIDPALFDNGILLSSSKEVWGIEAARVSQFRIAQARRFREWAFHQYVTGFGCLRFSTYYNAISLL